MKMTIPVRLIGAMALFALLLSSCSSSEDSAGIISDGSTDSSMKYPVKTEKAPEILRKETKNDRKADKIVPLTIVVKNLASPTAPVVIGVYNSNNGFLYSKARLNEYTYIPDGDQLTAVLTDIPYGVIAVAIYQDMNSNSAFDKNALGLPTEGYAFSNNYRPRLRAPEFDDCKFTYSEKMNRISVDLIK